MRRVVIFFIPLLERDVLSGAKNFRSPFGRLGFILWG
jgi:hypothetical protein